MSRHAFAVFLTRASNALLAASLLTFLVSLPASVIFLASGLALAALRLLLLGEAESSATTADGVALVPCAESLP